MSKKLITRCEDAWMTLEPFRRGRRRCKRLSYGTEGTSANNLIRQLLKSVVGRYRYLRAGTQVNLDLDVRNDLDLDARSLEEFLISGMTVNRLRLDPTEGKTAFVNVSPDRMFFSRFMEPDGSDATMIGMLHDFSATMLLQHFGNSDPYRCRALMEHYRGKEGSESSAPCLEENIDWQIPSMGGYVRVIEVWRRQPVHTLHCHDLKHAEYITLPFSEEAMNGLERLQAERRRDGEPGVTVLMKTDAAWLQTWLSPSGLILKETLRPDGSFPFVMRLYPMTDGETHSLVADVAPQQQHINRLVELLDRVIDQSAKGVLLFPTEQLPDGFTWRDMRRIWAEPGAIIPYKRTSRQVSPQQVSGTGWNQGAAEMLKTQISLFAEVSGMAPSFRGREAAFAGSEAAKVDSENASIALLDIMGAFHAFVAQRNKLLTQLKPQTL